MHSEYLTQIHLISFGIPWHQKKCVDGLFCSSIPQGLSYCFCQSRYQAKAVFFTPTLPLYWQSDELQILFFFKEVCFTNLFSKLSICIQWGCTLYFWYQSFVSLFSVIYTMLLVTFSFYRICNRCRKLRIQIFFHENLKKFCNIYQ